MNWITSTIIPPDPLPLPPPDPLLGPPVPPLLSVLVLPSLVAPDVFGTRGRSGLLRVARRLP